MSLRYRDGALVLELCEVEQRGELVERTQDQQLLQVEPAVDERDEIAFLRAEIEAVEVREELGGELRNRLHPFGVREKIADDRVADDLAIAAQRQVVGIGGTGFDELGP